MLKTERIITFHQEYSGLEYDDVMLRIFSGTVANSGLATRYKKMMKWAMENNAYIIDYDDLKNDITILQRFLNVESIDETKIVSELARWNPTKRKKILIMRRPSVVLSLKIKKWKYVTATNAMRV